MGYLLSNAIIKFKEFERTVTAKGLSEREVEADIDRGLDKELAIKVAEQLMERDALGAHIRDELGITEVHRARPIQAALASAATFAIGAAMPVMLAAFSGTSYVILTVSVSTLIFLALLGAIAAKTGGAKVIAGTFRVTFWGALAMGITAIVGMLFGAHV